MQVVDAVIYASRYPGSKQVLLRKTYPELERSIIRQFLDLVPRSMYSYNTSKHTVKFHNGSILDFGFCDTEDAVYKFQSQEIDCLRLDEAGHFTEFMYKYLRSRVRGANDFPHLTKSTGNPGGPGHVFLRSRFIEPAPALKPFEVKQHSKVTKRLFIPCTVYENPFLLEKDEDYIANLEDLPESERRQLLEGDWYVFKGQFFPEFKKSVHVLTTLPERTKDWRIYTTMDYGLDAFAWYVIAENEKGYAYVLGEIFESNVIISDAAKMAKAKLAELGIDKVDEALAPSDLWARRQETGKSVADIFMENGIRLHKTSRDRIDGWAATKEWLKPFKDEQDIEVAHLRIHESCVNLIRCLALLQYDEHRFGDAATNPHDITHCPDALRGFCVYRSRGNKEQRHPGEAYTRFESEINEFNSNDMFDVYGERNDDRNYDRYSYNSYNPMYL